MLLRITSNILSKFSIYWNYKYYIFTLCNIIIRKPETISRNINILDDER